MNEIILKPKQFLQVIYSTGNKLTGARINKNIIIKTTIKLNILNEIVYFKIDLIKSLGNKKFRISNSNVSLDVKLIN